MFIHRNSCLFIEMDENTDNERIMDIIAGSNNVPTYTEEERSQADGFLDISTTEDQDTTTEDQNTTTEDQDTAAEDQDTTAED